MRPNLQCLAVFRAAWTAGVRRVTCEGFRPSILCRSVRDLRDVRLDVEVGQLTCRGKDDAIERSFTPPAHGLAASERLRRSCRLISSTLKASGLNLAPTPSRVCVYSLCFGFFKIRPDRHSREGRRSLRVGSLGLLRVRADR